jgi:Domain of unknown function (DUF6531)
MNTKHLLFLFLFFSNSIFTNEDFEEYNEEFHELISRDAQDQANTTSVPMLANLDGEPSSIVNGVNVITGAFNSLHTDISIPGPEHLCLSRYYSSSTKLRGNLSNGWNFNHQGRLDI